jgi:N-acetylglucosamine-6-phosphate deacetylase
MPKMTFSDGHVWNDHVLGISDGIVEKFCPLSDIPSGAIPTEVDGVVFPGFIDLQVNGAGGVMFNNTPTPEGLLAIREALYKQGTFGILPTCITDTSNVLEACCDAVIKARSVPGILGIHIEGPHISLERRGTHSASEVRPFDTTTLNLIRLLRDNDVFTKITIAPEAIKPNEIGQLVEMGVYVAIGHTAASYEQTIQAIDAGARGFTHLFNAMPPIVNRDPGTVVAALNSDAFCGLICDGIHVSYEVLRMAIRAHAHTDRMFFVSDAMPTVEGPDMFELYDQTIRVFDGKLVNDEGSLAGAHISQRDNVHRALTGLGLSLEDALKMAITVPSTILGAHHLGSVLSRPQDNLFIADQEFTFIQSFTNA